MKTAVPSKENPFDLTKASDYSDRQVKDYWVDVASEKHSLVDFLKPTSLVPMLLLGGKGSGKTHLLRYCSSTVQELRHTDLRKAISHEKYLGIYTNADGLNAHRFTGKGQSEDVWETIFAYSFELWLAGGLLASLRPALANVELLSPEWNRSFAEKALALLHLRPAETLNNYDDVISYFSALRTGVDLVVNNTAITRTLSGIEIGFNPGDLVFGLPKIVAELCRFAQQSTFVYLVDEVENFTARQQCFLNSLVRYRKGNVTLRIGARLYGIKTYKTLNDGEPIKRDAEFEAVILDARLREDPAEYETLAARLVLKRLESVSLSRALTEGGLPAEFAEPSAERYYQQLSQDIVAARDQQGVERPHITRFRTALERIVGDSAIVQTVVDFLRMPEHPLLEKLNLLAFYKRLSRGANMLDLAQTIGKEAVALLELGPQAAPNHHKLYGYFSSDLLAQLHRDYGRKPVYAGFRTLVRLSQGVPRNLLSLLKHIYRRSSFAGENPFVHGPISVSAQVQGIQDAAEWFWEDAQPDAHGTLVRNAVEHLATLLRSVRYSESPSECDLCCFSVNRQELSDSAARVLKMAENWSFFIQVKGNSGAKNDDRVLAKFQINPMLAARWGISEARRGTIELKSDFAELILTDLDGAKTQHAINSRVDGMNFPKILEYANSSSSGRQTGLFDGL